MNEKKSMKYLLTLLLILGVTVEMKAADVYLLTAQKNQRYRW